MDKPVRILDRYIVREILPPFVIALLVFTFILIVPFIIEMAEQMIAKGVAWPTVIRLMVTLLPQALGLTIPMGLLIALLVGLGRLSTDREIVVMMACGVSPYRILRPVLILAVVAWAATSWVMIEAIPSSNQTYREITLAIVQDRAESQVRPRVFFEDFPNIVLYVGQRAADGGWQDVVAADTKNGSQPILYFARYGRMLVDRQAQTIQMMLQDGTRHVTSADDPSAYEVLRFQSTVVTLDPESVFPRRGPAPGDREMTIAQLRERIALLEKEGVTTHNPIMEIHKKFSIPAACFVFAVLGVALGVSNRKDGKLASLVLGIAVIFVYYVVMFTAQSLTKGRMVPPWLALWIPNILLGAIGAALIVSRARSADQPIRIALPALRLPAWWSRRATEASAGSAPAAAPRGAGNKVVLVIRIPHLRLPRPRLLDLYIAKLYLRILLMAFVGMAGLFYISTFIDLSDKWFKGETTLAMLLEYLWWATPQFVAYLLAIAVLLSALVTIGLLTKNSELIVMRACGISLYRTALPLLAFALLASAALFGLQERVLAAANRRAAEIRHVIKGGSPQTFDVLNRKWVVGRDGQVYHYQYYDPRRGELNGLSVFQFDPASHQIVRRVFAAQASFDPMATGEGTEPMWRVSNGWVREFSPTAQLLKYAPIAASHIPLEAAEYFVTEAPEPDRMNFQQLRTYIEELRASGYHVLEHEVALQRKLAFPLVTVVMTLIAVPFAVTTGRRGAMYGIGVGIVLALVYWTAISVFAAFGAAGIIHPALAAWAPNLLFGAAAAYLLLTVRT
jgi:LPS export ABC transporter permease LptF/LPS export ABC transporter permease LptG